MDSAFKGLIGDGIKLFLGLSKFSEETYIFLE